MTPRSLRPFALLTILLTCAACNSRPPVETARPSLVPVAAPATQSLRPPVGTDPRDTVPFLASDILAGRVAGSSGLDQAADFLADRFAQIGLAPLPGSKDYFQPFTMPLATTLAPGTSLLVNDRSLSLSSDFSPLSLTGEGPFAGRVVFAGYGITRAKPEPTTQPSPATAATGWTRGYDDYADIDARGKVVLVMRQEPRDSTGKSRFAAQHQQWSDAAVFGAKANNAAAHGATALLLVTPPSSGGADQVLQFFGEGGNGSKIPVIQISRRVAELLLGMGGAPDLKTLQEAIDASTSPRSTDLKQLEVTGNVAVKRTTATVRNVLAILPGAGERAGEYLVVGAHYDHLGTGQLGHMLGPVGSIYHGADDNASGTAALLALAAKMKATGPLPRSVVFALFTAEEQGLVGSGHFIKHPPVQLDQIVAMLNLDMVGRMKDQTILTGGWGTAPAFESIVREASAAAGLKTQSFEKGGLGPSDHMSFAVKKIPVLFLFTGLHADYHRPTDTADKINYRGIDRVIDASQRIITAMASMPRQKYDSSNDSKSTMAFGTSHGGGGGSRRAALGVVPDYGSSDAKNGVPISGVGGGSPADAAGFRAGDVLTSWNDNPLLNLQDLSDRLAQASPGDKVQITVRRGGKPVKLHATLTERTR